jgi:uncharacterized protein
MNALHMKLLTLAAFVSLVVPLAAPAAADGVIGGFIPGTGLVRVRVTPFTDFKFENIVRQHVDYSCGAAAIATILRYAYSIDATEDNVIRGMLAVSNADEVRRRGFSMLDMKHYVLSIGMSGSGYRLPMASLYEVKVPVVVLVNVQGYDHFVVMKKATPEYMYVADPILGNRTIPTAEFVKTWNGIIFVIASPSYDSANPLLALNVPVPFDRLTRTIPDSAQVLGNAELMSIYIPAMSRL